MNRRFRLAEKELAADAKEELMRKSNVVKIWEHSGLLIVLLRLPNQTGEAGGSEGLEGS